MLASEKVLKIVHLLGYLNKEGKTNIRPHMMNLLGALLCLNTFMYILFSKRTSDDDGDEVNHVILLLMAAKDMNCILTIFAFSFEYIFMNRNLENLLILIDKDFFKYGKEHSNKQKALISHRKLHQKSLLDKIGLLVCIIVSILIFLPLLITLYILITKGVTNVNVATLPLPIVFWFPESYDSIEVYVMAYVIQTLYLVYLLGHLYCAFGSIISAFQSILIDIKLFCIDIEEIDQVVFNPGNSQSQYEALKDYMKYFVMCHQNICRNVKLLDRCVSFILSACNQSICFQICVFLYCIAEIDNNFAKFAYFSIAVSESSILLIYCYKGQQVINGNDEIRRCLAQCSWLDKPNWFKKDLLIVMAMADKPLQIFPFRLYVLNLKSYTNIMNAAYSYFNILRTFHK